MKKAVQAAHLKPEYVAPLREFELKCRPDGWDELELRLVALEALGWSAPFSESDHLSALLTDTNPRVRRVVAQALYRSGDTEGLKYLFTEGISDAKSREDLVTALLCCSDSADEYLLKIFNGSLENSSGSAVFGFMSLLWPLWLLQRAKLGGAMDLLSIALSSSHHKIALNTAELLGTLYDPELFFEKSVDLMKLSKKKLAKPLASFSFSQSSNWVHMMSTLKRSYLSPPLSSSPLFNSDSEEERVTQSNAAAERS